MCCEGLQQSKYIQKYTNNTVNFCILLIEELKKERGNRCWKILFLKGYNPAFMFTCMITPNFLINPTLKTREM